MGEKVSPTSRRVLEKHWLIAKGSSPKSMMAMYSLAWPRVAAISSGEEAPSFKYRENSCSPKSRNTRIPKAVTTRLNTSRNRKV